MTLEPGTRLAHYEIASLLGKGGMGEVWLAKDTRLGREVAIKVLPAEFTSDPERLARFEREARVLASLDDANIASIYGIEEAGEVRFLVMQRAEGEDLAERLRRGPIPLEEAVAIALRIAEGLEAAHEKGIIHRDLKPANIKVDADGRVRILDFGLAKAFEGEADQADITNSPTMVRAATHAGVILGTAAYMSPEQARGLRVDERSDIWAFGVVLFEMLTGQRLFTGDTVSDVLAAVLREEPDLDSLPPSTPSPVRRVLRRCLEKNRKRRFHHIADIRIELSDQIDETNDSALPTPPSRPSRVRAALPWIVAALAAVVAVWAWLERGGEETQRTSVFTKLAPPSGASFIISSGFAISPDGARVVYGAQDGSGIPSLWLESLEDGTTRVLTGTEEGHYPFWSPDSRKIGFFGGSKLKTIDIGNLAVEVLAEATGRRGGAWGPNGVIVFVRRDGLFRVPANGGEVARIATNDSGTIEPVEFLSPAFLPDGSRFLYLARDYYDSEPERELRVGSIDGRTHEVVKRINSNALYAPSGELVWWENGNLRAQPFDLERLALSGEPRLLRAGVQFDPRMGLGMFSIAGNGTLLFRTGGIVAGDELARVDRNGSDMGAIGEAGNFYHPRLSPDGALVAVDRSDVTNRGDIWIYEVERGAGTRLTTNPVDESDPVWSPDGKRVAFFSGREGKGSVRVRSLRGGDDERLLYARPERGTAPLDWTSTGYVVLDFDQLVRSRFADLAAYSIENDAVEPVATTEFNEANASVAPGGGLVAYDSDETGRPEIYVQTFPAVTDRWRVSTSGGFGPKWSANGRELFYLNETSEIVAVAVEMTEDETSFRFGAPQVLFRADLKPLDKRQFDTIDGELFVLNRRVADLDPTPLTLVLHALTR